MLFRSVVRVEAERIHLLPVDAPVEIPRRTWGLDQDNLYAVGLGVALLFGVCLRLIVPIGASFPLGDGGMFYQMVQDLLAHHLVPPTHTTYNHANIPFAYPFVGFYIIALLHLLTGIGILPLMQWMPPLVCCLSLGAFVLLARSLLPSRLAQIVAVAAFGLLPNSFLWEIKGGGVTRAWGELFCLLGLYYLARLLRHGDRNALIPSGIFVGLTVASHLEWLWFLVYSAVVFWFILGRTRTSFRDCAMVGLIGALVSAPWWIVEVHRYGPRAVLATFTGSAQALPLSSFFGSVISLNFVSEEWFPVFTALAIVGLLYCYHRREWLLPSWLLTVLVLNWRGPTDRAVVPVALLAGLGVTFLTEHQAYARTVARGWTRAALVVAAFVLLRTFLADCVYETATPPSLTASERTAMQWVSSHTSATSRFAVVSGAVWALDDNAEWLPALTGRTSVSTVQGTEWLPGVFARRVQFNVRLQKCASAGVTCLEDWMRASSSPVDYVYVAGRPLDGASTADCCSGLRLSLEYDPHYREVFRAGTTAIFQRLQHA